MTEEVRTRHGGSRVMDWIKPILIAGLVVLVVAAAVIGFGLLDLRATTPHSKYFGNFIHMVFRRATSLQSAGVDVPGDLNDPARIAIGAGHYANVCANCHGGPGFGQSPAMMSMSPRPPWLPAVKTMDDRELFWIIKHGVMMSAMPGWTTQKRDDEVWSMVAFVRTLPKQSPAMYRQLVEGGVEADVADALPRIAFGPPTAPQTYKSFNSDIAQLTTNRFKTPVWGPGNIGRDDNPLATCARCHGAAGRGRPEGGVPNLTAQTAEQLRQQLTDYATGKRESGVMQAVAVQLSPSQIDGVARYYAALPPAAAVSASKAPVPDVDVTKCNGCHNVAAESALIYPQLRGQDRKYIAGQLRLFRDGTRAGVRGSRNMSKVASTLTDAQIEAYAQYFAAQTPVDPNNVASPLRDDLTKKPRPAE